jgi:hypothetical protein
LIPVLLLSFHKSWLVGLIGLWFLTPLPTIFHLYRGGQFQNKSDVRQHLSISLLLWSRRRRDRMIVGFTTTYTISAYHH